MKLKRSLALTLAAATLTGILAGCGSTPAGQATPPASVPSQPTAQQLSAETEQTAAAPKYVFLFIGSQAVQERYRALRDRTAELRRTGQYDLQSRLEAARELGRLLGYTPEAVERMIAANPEA